MPGPRGNLELLDVVVEDAPADLLLQLAGLEADAVPTNTPDEFLPACGVACLGRLLAGGDTTVLPTLRKPPRCSG